MGESFEILRMVSHKRVIHIEADEFDIAKVYRTIYENALFFRNTNFGIYIAQNSFLILTRLET